MERTPNVNEERVLELRAERDAGAATRDLDLTKRIGADGVELEPDTPPQPGEVYADRSDRPALAYYRASSGAWLPAPNLAIDDDVMIYGIVPARVISTASDRSWIAVYNPEFFGDDVCLADIAYITDRAPKDPTATPMPIYPGGYGDEPEGGGAA